MDKLKLNIDQLNKLNKDELDDLYREKLRSGKISEKGGAGLGLVDLARESSDKIFYEFIPINENISFFSLMIKI